jgi:hypothetical protein
MKPSTPPPVATWLLRRFGSGRGIESLTGDLMEGYAHGRSVAWYWRQVLFAIVTGFGKEVRAHKLLAVRAIVTGWTVWLVLCILLRDPPPVPPNGSILLERVLPANWWMHLFYPYVLITCVVSAASGWVVARFHRPHQTAMVLVFAISILLCRLPWVFTLVVDAFDNSRYLPALSVQVDWTFLTVGSILFGGLLSVPAAINPPIEERRSAT